MDNRSDEKLNRLLKEAYPTVPVSPDFTLNLWHKLMKSPTPSPWIFPVPVYSVAAAVGILFGVWTGLRLSGPMADPRTAYLRQTARLDLFGNAPVDSVAGSFIHLIKEG